MVILYPNRGRQRGGAETHGSVIQFWDNLILKIDFLAFLQSQKIEILFSGNIFPE
jgi:hypothetical protein